MSSTGEIQDGPVLRAAQPGRREPPDAAQDPVHDPGPRGHAQEPLDAQEDRGRLGGTQDHSADQGGRLQGRRHLPAPAGKMSDFEHVIFC